MQETYAEKAAVKGTASEIIAYLKNRNSEGRYLLTEESPPQETPLLLSFEEEEKLLDELGQIAKGRLQPGLTYNREDIYFDYD